MGGSSGTAARSSSGSAASSVCGSSSGRSPHSGSCRRASPPSSRDPPLALRRTIRHSGENPMPSYLIVANQTLSSPTLMAEVRQRARAGDVHFHVVVPATPIPHALTWDEAEARAAAQQRLDDVLGRLRSLGAQAGGEVGCSDPIAATQDALRGQQVDEV